MKIAVIDNYDSFVFNLIRYLEEIDGCEVIVQRNDAINYEEINACDSLLLSPGPGIPSEAGELMAIIDKYKTEKPILGVCLGHQALLESFGCELSQNEYPLHGKSSLIKHHYSSPLFIKIDKEFEVGRYHSWSIKENTSAELEIIASTKEGEIMAFAHKQLSIYGTQFHPESILTPQGRKIINNWVTICKSIKKSKI